MARIGHLIRTFLAPTETFIYAVIQNHRRHEPFVFTRRYEHRDRFPHEQVFASSAGLRGVSRMVSGVSYHLLRTAALPELSWLAEQIRAQDIRVLHGHFGTDARYFLGLKRRTGLPLVATFYGYDVSSFPRWYGGYGRRYLQGLFREADRIVAISEFMRDQLVALGCPREKIRVIHFGITLDPFTFRERRLREDEPIKLLHVGRFVAKKGHADLLLAMERVREANPRVRLQLAGTGPLYDEMCSIARDRRLTDQVEFLGYQHHQRVAELMAESHIYIQPSVTTSSGDMEGTPTTLMEAMATGMPVIATRHAGIPEMVRDGVNGRLVPERSPQELAAAILEMAENAADWPTMGRAGRTVVEEEFQASRETEKLEDLYDELLGDIAS